MQNKQILLTRPPGCCDACIEHAAVSHESMIAVYCKHTQTGAWIRKNKGDLLGRWTALAPIPAEEFAAFLGNIVFLKHRRHRTAIKREVSMAFVRQLKHEMFCLDILP